MVVSIICVDCDIAAFMIIINTFLSTKYRGDHNYRIPILAV